MSDKIIHPKIAYLLPGYNDHIHLHPKGFSNEIDGKTEKNEETDCLPSQLEVETHHLICFYFSILSYIFDMCSDIVLASEYLFTKKILPGILTLTSIIISLLVMNVLSFRWIKEDSNNENSLKKIEKEMMRESKNHSAFLPRLLIAQLGPLWWHYKALQYAWKFKKEESANMRKFWFCLMIESERDATLLRVFEAFLESAPQLILQTVLLFSNYENMLEKLQSNEGIPRYVYIQVCSIGFSLISLCWALCSQHRTIRMARKDKINIRPLEMLAQLTWRLLTTLSRTIIIVLVVFTFKYFSIFCLILHCCLSFLHINKLQAAQCTSISRSFKRILFTATIFIHIFTPFNAVDGSSRYRYGAAFLIEFLEAQFIFIYVYCSGIYPYNVISSLYISNIALFSSGILCFVSYYTLLHPNRRRKHLMSVVNSY